MSRYVLSSPASPSTEFSDGAKSRGWLLPQGTNHGVRVLRDHSQQYLGGTIRTMSTLLPVPHGSQRQAEPLGKLLLRQIHAAAEGPYLRHALSARQSVFGGFFGLSLSFVVFPFLMRLGSSGRYDADDIASHRVGDK